MNQLQESILASEKQAAGQTAEENIAAAGLHKRVHDKADKIAQRMASDTVFSKAMDAQDKSKSKSISGLVDWIRTMILTFFNAIINIFNYRPGTKQELENQKPRQLVKDTPADLGGSSTSVPSESLVESQTTSNTASAATPSSSPSDDAGKQTRQNAKDHQQKQRPTSTTVVNGPILLSNQCSHDGQSYPTAAEEALDEFLAVMKKAANHPEINAKIQEMYAESGVTDQTATKHMMLLAETTLAEITKAKLEIEANIANEIMMMSGTKPSNAFFIAVQSLVKALPQDISKEIFSSPIVANAASQVLADHTDDIVQFVALRNLAHPDLLNLINNDHQKFLDLIRQRLDKSDQTSQSEDVDSRETGASAPNRGKPSH